MGTSERYFTQLLRAQWPAWWVVPRYPSQTKLTTHGSWSPEQRAHVSVQRENIKMEAIGPAIVPRQRGCGRCWGASVHVSALTPASD